MKKLTKGIGIWQILKDNVITDIICSAGFDVTLLDLEHGLHDIHSIQNAVFASNQKSLAIARVPIITYPNLVQLIDTGIDGILYPHVETKEQIEIICQQTLIAPDGNKSFSPFSSRYKYGLHEKELLNPLIGIIIESIKGIKNLDELLDNKFLDFVYFGAYDLSVEMGLPGQIFSELIKEQLNALNKRAKIFNKKVFAIYRSLEELEILREFEVEYPIASVDTSHLSRILKKEVDLYKHY